MAEQPNRRALEGPGRHRRILLWTFLAIALGTVSLPLGGYLHVYLASPPAAHAQGVTEPHINPRSQYWRAVRQGEKGYTSVPGGPDRQVLIQSGGENWREIRNGPVASIGPWVLAAVLLAIFLFHALRGPLRLPETLSGNRVPRWTAADRALHWYTAVLFIVLTVTGLSLLFGRAALIPIFGLRGFAAYADLVKGLHNYLGPFFVVGVIAELIAWLRMNFFIKADLAWLRTLGGMLGKGAHPHAGRTNAGEKVWFWIIATVGLVGVCASGLVLDFPNFDQSRETMQFANIIHSSFAILWIAIFFGHVYLGTAGVHGTLDAMTKGHVSEEWARLHHDLWYQELQARGGRASVDELPASTPEALKQPPS
jgi:formate dehydrogenase subunit gamma